MKKFLVIGAVALLCGLGAVSCGNETPFDAVLDMPILTAPTGDLACGDSLSYTGVQVKVRTADGAVVPGADVYITPIGIGLGGGVGDITTILAGDLSTVLAGTDGNPAYVWHTTTDKTGAVYVNVISTFGGAPTTSFTPTMGFTVTISGDQQDATVGPTVSC